MASRRQKRSAKRTALFWAHKREFAGSDASAAVAVEFDRVRALIRSLAPALRGEGWKAASEGLVKIQDHIQSITQGDISGKEISQYPAKRGFHGQTRASAREKPA